MTIGYTSSYFSRGKCIWPSVPRDNFVLETMHGLGDTLYQRAFVRCYPEAYVITPWPELYADLPVKCVKSPLWLHYTTPKDSQYAPTPPYLNEFEKVRFWYFPNDLEVREPRTITGAFERITARTRKSNDIFWDLPPLPPSRHPGCAFIRPVSARGYDFAPSRACDPAYLAEAARILKDKGFTTVTASYAVPGKEAIIDPPEVDHAYNEGQLSVLELLALVKEAAVCVGPVSWYVPAVFCAGTPSAVIMGGYQKHNSPPQLVDARQDSSHITWFQTDNPCLCSDMAHKCDKTISQFNRKFTHWAEQHAR